MLRMYSSIKVTSWGKQLLKIYLYLENLNCDYNVYLVFNWYENEQIATLLTFELYMSMQVGNYTALLASVVKATKYVSCPWKHKTL